MGAAGAGAGAGGAGKAASTAGSAAPAAGSGIAGYMSAGDALAGAGKATAGNNLVNSLAGYKSPFVQGLQDIGTKMLENAGSGGGDSGGGITITPMQIPGSVPYSPGGGGMQYSNPYGDGFSQMIQQVMMSQNPEKRDPSQYLSSDVASMLAKILGG